MEKKPEHEALLRYLHEKLAADLNPRERRLRGNEGVRRMADTACALVSQLRPGQIRVEIANRAMLGGERTIVHALLPEQPFLVDSFRMTLARRGMREKLLLHPSLAIDREEDGAPAALGSGAGGREVYLYAEVSLVPDASSHRELELELQRVLGQLQHVVADHGAMLETLRAHTEGIEAVDRQGRSHARELMDFLYWLAGDNFVFLGYRRYNLLRHGQEWRLRLQPGSGLGLLRDPASSRFVAEQTGEQIPELIRSRADDELLVFFDKSNTTSIVHREGRLDTISIKTFNEQGELCGFGKFIGLLTYQGVRSRPSDIPIIRRRRERVLAELAAERGSHTYKAAIEGFDSLPLEFLFAFHTPHITKAIRTILRAYEGRSIEIVAIPAPLARSFFVSVILPRALYRENLRSDLRTLFIERYAVSYLDHRSSFVDDDCALIHFFCTTNDDIDREVLSALRRDVKRCTMRWEDRFEAALLARFPEDEAYRLSSEYESGFPQEYRVVTPPEEADRDLVHLERIRTGAASVELTFGELDEGGNGADDTVCLKIYQRERPYLTDPLPLLDQFGLRAMDAHLTEVRCRSGAPLWIGAFDVERRHDAGASLRDREQRLVEGMRSVLSGRADRDSLNSLIFGVGLDWRQVDLLRAYFAYAAQIGFMVRLKTAAETLLRYPDATRALLALFAARFDPDLSDRESAEALAFADLASARERIPTADEDRILGMLDQLVRSTSRTSFYATDASQELIAFKLDASLLADAPYPRPWKEIFVHSVEMSGVHLRGGPIARGGIRWSDRNQDFRKEVLGLLKTQTVKNALIVPVGAKGGFVLRQRFDDPTRTRREADRQYARFIRALLCLTDNVQGGVVVPPKRVVRHDGDDPYLVVAADKGTAHLSDTANGIAAELGFWLSDAFASGGSDGYDHKQQGITARGGWACVRRHFLERGIDVEVESFTMAGIGDMSGDVFGNALVIARNARLLAAFNHQHVFLDPDPDPDAAWRERKRLFELPRSTWRDYDRAAISTGGGIFDRSARSISLSTEVRRVLGVSEAKLSGEQIVRAILRMPVDLLWNGGIGTYVKSRSETHADAGDRANDSVRIDACDLRARVIGEGGNLGFTQLARVEYALAGGCINTDAIDNSGGVNLSDLEVNFKILFSTRLAQGTMPRAERNALLRECAPHACAYVISHNDSQSHAVSLDRMRAVESPERLNLAAHFLEQRAGLDPRLEFLPSTDELRSRARPGRAQSYTRPELAVLLGYTKLFCKRELAASPLIDHPSFAPVLAAYFPERLREAFADDIHAHALRRQITAAALSNRVIDRAGVTLLPELSRTQGASLPEILASYYTIDHLLEADSLRWAIERQDVPEDVRLLASRRLESAVRSGTRVRLGLERSAVLEPADLEQWRTQVRALRAHLSADPTDPDLARVIPRAQTLVARGLDEKLAHEIERLPIAVRAMGSISIALKSGMDLPRVVRMHAGVGRVTRVSWLLDRIEDLERRSGWERIAVETLFLELLAAQRAITARMLESDSDTDAVDAFCREHAHTLDAIHESAREIDAEEMRSLPPLTVIAQMIRRLG